MKLRAITRAETNAALALLGEGFPILPPDIWRMSVERMFTYADRTCGGVIGQIASAGGRDVGICLAIPANRTTYVQQARREINLSSFYLRPGNEWMTTLFLRRLMADDAFEYLDVTASHSIREINRRLGFSDHPAGPAVVPTFVAACRPSWYVRLLSPSQVPASALEAAQRRIVKEHQHLGCICLVIEDCGNFHPVILAPTSRKGVPGARVLLARDPLLVRRAIGGLSRHLLRSGTLFIECDGLAATDLPEAAIWGGSGPTQVTNPPAGEAIDLTFSELAFIPPKGLRMIVRHLSARAKKHFLGLPVVRHFEIYADPATGVALKFVELGVL